MHTSQPGCWPASNQVCWLASKQAPVGRRAYLRPLGAKAMPEMSSSSSATWLACSAWRSGQGSGQAGAARSWAMSHGMPCESLLLGHAQAAESARNEAGPADHNHPGMAQLRRPPCCRPPCCPISQPATALLPCLRMALLLCFSPISEQRESTETSVISTIASWEMSTPPPTCRRPHMRESTRWQRPRCSVKAMRSRGAGPNLTLRHALACARSVGS